MTRKKRNRDKISKFKLIPNSELRNNQQLSSLWYTKRSKRCCESSAPSNKAISSYRSRRPSRSNLVHEKVLTAVLSSVWPSFPFQFRENLSDSLLGDLKCTYCLLAVRNWQPLLFFPVMFSLHVRNRLVKYLHKLVNG